MSRGEVLDTSLAVAFCEFTAMRARRGWKFGGPAYAEEDAAAQAIARDARRDPELRRAVAEHRRLLRQMQR